MLNQSHAALFRHQRVCSNRHHCKEGLFQRKSVFDFGMSIYNYYPMFRKIGKMGSSNLDFHEVTFKNWHEIIASNISYLTVKYIPIQIKRRKESSSGVFAIHCFCFAFNLSTYIGFGWQPTSCYLPIIAECSCYIKFLVWWSTLCPRLFCSQIANQRARNTSFLNRQLFCFSLSQFLNQVPKSL